jgi:hypothetical protein
MREREIDMESELIKNFYNVQRKIEEIVMNNELHIKQISDLDRYVHMQKEIIISLSALRSSK